MRKSLKPLWLLIAALLLLEAWLWALLVWAGRVIVGCLPFDEFKARIARAVENLPPLVVLPIPFIPATIIVPLKIGGLWLIGHKHFVSGTAAFSAAELVGLCLGAVLFDLCRDKLLTLGWFSWTYPAPCPPLGTGRMRCSNLTGGPSLSMLQEHGGSAGKPLPWCGRAAAGASDARLSLLRMRIRRIRRLSR